MFAHLSHVLDRDCTHTLVPYLQKISVISSADSLGSSAEVESCQSVLHRWSLAGAGPYLLVLHCLWHWQVPLGVPAVWEEVARVVGHHWPGLSCSLFLVVFTLRSSQDGKCQLDEMFLCQQHLGSAVFLEEPTDFPSAVPWRRALHATWEGYRELKIGSSRGRVTSSTGCSGTQKTACRLNVDNLQALFQLETTVKNGFTEWASVVLFTRLCDHCSALPIPGSGVRAQVTAAL